MNEALIELALDASRLVRGGQTLADAVGVQLAKEGCEKGQPVVRRLEGARTRTEVNQWRRGDVYRIVGIAVQRDFSHLLVDDPSAGSGGLPLLRGMVK